MRKNSDSVHTRSGDGVVRNLVDRKDAAAAGIDEKDCQRLEEILREAGLARLSPADLERQAQRILTWARSVGRRKARAARATAGQ